jgi:putative peptidoglycan lipid II flippase
LASPSVFRLSPVPRYLALSTRHRQLMTSTLIVLALSLVAKLSGAFKEVVLAKELGTSALMDQFVFAYYVATLPSALLGSVLTLALTPVLSGFNAHDSVAKQRFIAQIWGACLVFGVVMAASVGWFFPLLSPVASAGGSQLAAVVAVVTFVTTLSTLATALLICHGKQIGGLLDGVPSLVLGSCILIAIAVSSERLYFALVLGIVLQLLTLVVAYWRLVGPVQIAVPAASAHWHRLSSGLGFATAGYALLTLALVVETQIASHLATGSVASLGYATRITSLMTGLLLTAVNRVAVVHFCDTRGKFKTHWQACSGVLMGFAGAAALASLAVIVFAPEIVSLFYERGRFDAAASQTVSHLTRWHIAQLAPSVAASVLGAYLSATGGFRAIFVACAAGFAAEISFAYLGVQQWDLDALAAAPMVGRTVMFACMLWAILRRPSPVFVPSTHSTTDAAATV